MGWKRPVLARVTMVWVLDGEVGRWMTTGTDDGETTVGDPGGDAMGATEDEGSTDGMESELPGAVRGLPGAVRELPGMVRGLPDALLVVPCVAGVCGLPGAVPCMAGGGLACMAGCGCACRTGPAGVCSKAARSSRNPGLRPCLLTGLVKMQREILTRRIRHGGIE
jgi:hypothetical protein